MTERRNPSPEFLYENKWRIFGVMMIGWAMALLDISIVNISIPELQDEMSTDIGTVTWVINAYNIVFAVLLVSMGRLADQFGRRRFFVIGLAVFTIGSALCAVAWSVEWLIVFRVIQGAGAGILAPLGFAMTILVFPPQQRGFGLALIAVVALVSSAFGPVLGGVLIEMASWHWIFLINIPFGIVGIMLALRWWPETWDLSAVGKQVDVRGMLLLGGAVLFLTMALVEANPFGGDLPLWLSLMQGAILLGILFFWWERRAPDPMITPGPAVEPPVPQREHRNAVLRRRGDRLAAAAVARVREPVGLHAARGGARDRAGPAVRAGGVAVRGPRRGHPAARRARKTGTDSDGRGDAVGVVPARDRGRRLGLHPHPARAGDDRSRDGDRLPGTERGRHGRGRRARSSGSRRECSTPPGSSAPRSAWRS